MDCTVHGILQSKISECSHSLLQGSSKPRDQTQVSHIAGGFFTSWATREAQEYWRGQPFPSPGDLPDPGIEAGSPALQVGSLPAELPGKPLNESHKVLNVRNWNFHFPVAFKMPLTLETNHLTVKRGCGDWINFHIWIWVEDSSAKGYEAFMDHLAAAQGSDNVSSRPSSKVAHPGGQPRGRWGQEAWGAQTGSGQKLNAKRATFKEAGGGRGGNESGEVRWEHCKWWCWRWWSEHHGPIFLWFWLCGLGKVVVN